MQNRTAKLLLFAACAAVAVFLSWQAWLTRVAAEGAYEHVTHIGDKASEVLLTMNGTWNFTFDCKGMTVTFTCTGTWTECKAEAEEAQKDCNQ